MPRFSADYPLNGKLFQGQTRLPCTVRHAGPKAKPRPHNQPKAAQLTQGQALDRSTRTDQPCANQPQLTMRPSHAPKALKQATRPRTYAPMHWPYQSTQGLKTTV